MHPRVKAKKIADSYLSDPNTNIVFVADNGLVLINEDPLKMVDFFKSIRQQYWVFEKTKKVKKSKQWH